MERKLHIGGKEAKTGWEILNVTPGPQVDHVGDALDLSRFADNTFSEIYASHVLEHFDYQVSLTQALVEWKRVLAPGGSLRLSVPDLDTLASLLLQRDKLDVNQRFHVMRMMFGGHTDAHDYHLVGLNQDFLVTYLSAAGFTEAYRVTHHEGLFNDTSNMVFGGVPISLNVVAVKAPVVQATADAVAPRSAAEVDA